MGSEMPEARPLVLVTGATGYIGGRLVPRLLQAGYRVRCLARSPEKLRGRPWSSDWLVETVAGDAADEQAVEVALAGCRAAYYLIHSMMVAGKAYAERDLALARTFGRAAALSGVTRIIYLGGLGEEGDHLSRHLSSRRAVEAALGEGGVPVTTLRAAMIIGSGSASFEILRYLTERLPVMVTPRWVGTACQPIAVRNVLAYLVAALETPATVGQALDIGGPEILTYREMMQTMAAALGLPRRVIVGVPLLTPRLSSLWIHLVTPISQRIARPLAEGLRNPVVCRSSLAADLMPQNLLSVREAIDAALGRTSAHQVESSWLDAGPIPGDPDWSGGTLLKDHRSRVMESKESAVFAALCRIGGTHGWYAADPLWHLRGLMDRLAGGPGLQRGRRHPDNISYGDALDFWRVTGIERDASLCLRAEMKLPGEAELEFQIEPPAEGSSGCRLHQIARFKPRGLLGLAYWYATMPFHAFVFSGMLRGIAKEARAIAAASGASPQGGQESDVSGNGAKPASR